MLESPEVIAMTMRSDAALGTGWDELGANLEHLARHGRMRFVTGAAIAADLEPSKASRT